MSIEEIQPGVKLHHTPEKTIVVPESWELEITTIRKKDDQPSEALMKFEYNVERIPLVGNKSARQRTEMIQAILKSRGLR